MIRSFFYEENGTFIDVIELQRVRCEFLLRKKGDVGLNGDELRELETNHYARWMREEYKEALYGKLMLVHSMEYRNRPKE